MCVCVTSPPVSMQVYRSVLLNNGPRRSPPPDTSSAAAEASSEPSEAPPTSPQAQQPTVTPLEELLYPAGIGVGTRGDIIQFYNKVFIGYIKDFVLQFSPRQSEVSSVVPLYSAHHWGVKMYPSIAPTIGE